MKLSKMSLCDLWGIAMHNLFTVIRFTISDVIRHKSFVVLLGLGVLLVLFLRGCYGGSYVVNGRAVDSVTVAWHASRVAFHLIATLSILVSALLSMGIFRRERNEGAATMVLSRAVGRWQLALGTYFGLSFIMMLFMSILHVAIFGITFFSAGGIMPGFLTASAVCWLNILLITALVMVFSFFLPDFMAGLFGIAVAGISFLTDSAFRILQSDFAQQAFQGEPSIPLFWRTFISFWPKMNALQTYAVSLTGGNSPSLAGPLHPAVNVGLYAAAFAGLLLWRFRHQEY